MQRTEALAVQAQNFNTMNSMEKQNFIAQVKEVHGLMKSHLDRKWRNEPHPFFDCNWKANGPEAVAFREANKDLLSALTILKNIKHPDRQITIELLSGKAGPQKPIHVTVANATMATAKLRDLKPAVATAFGISADSICQITLHGETNGDRYLRELIQGHDVAFIRINRNKS
jgi:hypothetical protein